MKKNIKLEKMLCELGQSLKVGKEEIKTTLKSKKGPIVAGAIILVGTIITGNLAYLGQRYAAISPIDFWSILSEKFPFSLLF